MFFSIVIMLGVSLALASYAPYHFYELALNEGIESRFLNMEKPRKSFLRASAERIGKLENVFEEKNKMWGRFHFYNFKFSLPLQHPYFVFIPDISYNEKTSEVQRGGKLTDQAGNLVASFRVLKSKRIEYPFDQNQLFRLPIFKKRILDSGNDKIWKDLFSQDMFLPQFEKDFLSSMEKLYSISYGDLVYKLFLLKTRQKIFPEILRNISYFSKRNMGVIKTGFVQENKVVKNNFIKEIFHVYENGLIHRIELISSPYKKISKNFRKRFINSLEYKQSSEDSAISLYARFRKLKLDKKTTQEGMTYLFSAWSHVPGKEGFMRHMIELLERKQGKYQLQLDPLYEYSYKRFGTSFSSRKEYLQETEQRKLERKISEEFREEVKKSEKMDVDPKDEFQSKEKKVKYLLQKGKEGPQKSSERSLIVE